MREYFNTICLIISMGAVCCGTNKNAIKQNVISSDCKLCCDCQETDSNICITSKGFEGVVLKGPHIKRLPFPWNVYPYGFDNIDTSKTWNPSYLDILKVEEQISTEIIPMLKTEIGDESHSIILENYIRQYVGIYERTGEKAIIIGFNFFASKQQFHLESEAFISKFRIYNDGGKKYFLVRYNMSKRSFYDLRLNNE